MFNRGKGFTLLEMSAVLVILGVIIVLVRVMVLPGNAYLRKKAVENDLLTAATVFIDSVKNNSGIIPGPVNVNELPDIKDSKGRKYKFFSSYAANSNICSYNKNDLNRTLTLNGETRKVGIVIMPEEFYLNTYFKFVGNDIKYEGTVGKPRGDNSNIIYDTSIIAYSHEELYSIMGCEKPKMQPEMLPSAKMNTAYSLRFTNSMNMPLHWCIEVDNASILSALNRTTVKTTSETVYPLFLDNNSLCLSAGDANRNKVRSDNITLNIHGSKLSITGTHRIVVYTSQNASMRPITEKKVYGLTVRE